MRSRHVACLVSGKLKASKIMEEMVGEWGGCVGVEEQSGCVRGGGESESEGLKPISFDNAISRPSICAALSHPSNRDIQQEQSR